MSRSKYLLNAAALVVCGMALSLSVEAGRPWAVVGWATWTLFVIALNAPRRTP